MNEFKNLTDIEKSIYKSLLISKKLKKDLMAEFDLPKTTINRILQNLLSKSLIKENGLTSSTGGRPAIIYAPSESLFYVVGVDISRSYSELVILNSSLDTLFKKRFQMDTLLSPEDSIINIANSLSSAIDYLSIDKEKIIGIGLGVVEPIDPKTGVIGTVTNALNQQWNNLNIKKLFEKYFDIPVLIDRGTNMGALGESFINSNTNIDKIIYLNLGLGIRYGLVHNGKVIDSFNPIYDALGHMVVDINGEKCQCGKNGCLELYGTILAMKNNYAKATNTTLSIDEIIEKSTSGDLNAISVIDNSLNALAIGINNFFNILNPNKVIINGPLIQKNPYIFEKLTNYIKELNHNKNAIDSIYFKDSYFGESIISIGAAITFIINYIDRT